MMKELGQVDVNQDAALATAQLDFLTYAFQEMKMPVFLIGGFADDALLAQALTRTRRDIDMVALRGNKDNVRQVFEDKGFTVEEVVVPPATEPYKLRVTTNKFHVDVALLEWDENNKHPFMNLVNPDSGEKFKILFDKEGLNYAAQSIAGVSVNVVSPLALIQTKGIYAQIGSTEPHAKHRNARAELLARFFPNEDPNSVKFKPSVLPA